MPLVRGAVFFRAASSLLLKTLEKNGMLADGDESGREVVDFATLYEGWGPAAGTKLTYVQSVGE